MDILELEGRLFQHKLSYETLKKALKKGEYIVNMLTFEDEDQRFFLVGLDKLVKQYGYKAGALLIFAYRFAKGNRLGCVITEIVHLWWANIVLNRDRNNPIIKDIEHHFKSMPWAVYGAHSYLKLNDKPIVSDFWKENNADISSFGCNERISLANFMLHFVNQYVNEDCGNSEFLAISVLNKHWNEILKIEKDCKKKLKKDILIKPI